MNKSEKNPKLALNTMSNYLKRIQSSGQLKLEKNYSNLSKEELWRFTNMRKLDEIFKLSKF